MAPVCYAWRMGRARKTERDEEINRFVGDKAKHFRTERSLTLVTLAEQLGISPSHLKGLESGRYSFSASGLVALATALDRPVSAFLPVPPRREPPPSEWWELFGAIGERDRRLLLELARKLAGWNKPEPATLIDAGRSAGSRLIAIEGINGLLLRNLGQQLVTAMTERGEPASLIWYDFDDPLMRCLLSVVRDLNTAEKHQPELQPVHAYWKTMLFACERLQRQQTLIRAELDAGRSVVTPFFSMAPAAYQQVDGVADSHVPAMVESLMLTADLIALVASDPKQAAAHATLQVPGPKQFYSPYVRIGQFKRALLAYKEVAERFTHRGYQLLVQDAREQSEVDLLVDSILTALGFEQ